MQLRQLIFIAMVLIGWLTTSCRSNTIEKTTTLQPDAPQAIATATPVAIAAQPTVTDTPLPIPTPSPTANPTATVTPSPELRQLVQGGCCVQPFFSPNGQQVLFIDKPDAEAPVGIYGIDLTHPPATPTLINDVIGFRSPDRTIVATMDGDLAQFVDETSGERWRVDTGGNWPTYSPDAQQILWEARDAEGAFDARQTDVWLADLRGNNPRLITTVRGGGVVGWLPDKQRLVLTSRDVPGEDIQSLWVLDINTGQKNMLAREKRLRGITISPGGQWIVFFVTFSNTPGNSGIWLANPAGTILQKLDVPGFGAYHWRNDTTLIYIPMRQTPTDSMQLWSVDVVANTSQPLTDPTQLVFSISNGDWTVSPDGQNVVFVNSVDQNLWLINLHGLP
ncbi:MAG: PD40 domain-containing protein [Anaerolineae bacterium]|nr:PD40 domain-containing protein [Anaerolineae bacterium]